MVLESMNILTMLYSSQEDMLNNAVNGLILTHPDTVALAQRLRTDVSTLRELSERHIHSHDQDVFCGILHELSVLCRLPTEKTSRHAMNQMVIDNSNVIGIMINVIKSDYPQESKTLVAVFDFLAALAFKNEKVQTELFDFVNDMLRCTSSDQSEDEENGEATFRLLVMILTFPFCSMRKAHEWVPLPDCAWSILIHSSLLSITLVSLVCHTALNCCVWSVCSASPSVS